MRFLLIHSPLVGPATWRWVAAALEARGHDVAVPDLRGAAVTGDPMAVIRHAAANQETDVLVGHSGAGLFLPSIAATATQALVFVDAVLPPCQGDATPSADFLKVLRSLAVDGLLPKWSTWWGDGVMEELIPDRDRRAAVEAEIPEVPLAFYQSPIASPAGWCERPAAYLLLSEAYRTEATRAIAGEWPLIERPGAHLDMVSHPDAIADDILELVSRTTS